METTQLLAYCMDAWVDISRWWPKDEEGRDRSVNWVYTHITDEEIKVTRHTLTRAREAQLFKADIDNLVKLARLCSGWSGQKVTLDDIVRTDEEGDRNG